MSVKKPRHASKIGRKRRAAGWTLLALGVVVAAVWVASGWWSVGWSNSKASAECAAGRVTWNSSPNSAPLEAEWSFDSTYAAPRWIRFYGIGRWELEAIGFDACIWRVTRFPNGSESCEFVFWPSPLLLWAPAALLLRSGIIVRRRALTNTCPECGYALAGLAKDAPCPECGKKMPSPSTQDS